MLWSSGVPDMCIWDTGSSGSGFELSGNQGEKVLASCSPIVSSSSMARCDVYSEWMTREANRPDTITLWGIFEVAARYTTLEAANWLGTSKNIFDFRIVSRPIKTSTEDSFKIIALNCKRYFYLNVQKSKSCSKVWTSKCYNICCQGQSKQSVSCQKEWMVVS